MKKTFKELFNFIGPANFYVDGDKANGVAGHDDKLSYAIKKVQKRLEAAKEDWNEKLADLQYDHASLDKTGNMIRDEHNRLVFTPAKQKEFDKKVKELRAETFEFEPYYATELPEKLDEFVKEIFTGFVIKQDDAQS